MPLSAPLVILGQITSAAFAAGLNLYLTVALVGISSRLNLLPALPPGLQGLENSVIIGSALGLYLVEFVVDKVPHLDSAWDALHTVIRPLGTALLAALALDAAPLEFQLAGAVVAGVVALGAHGTKAGLRLVLNRSPSKFRSVLISTSEDLFAAVLAVVALQFPVAGLGAGALAILILVLLGPRLWRAATLAIRAFRARLRAFFGSPGWRPLGELPPRMRTFIQEPPLGRAAPRAIRAAFKGLPGVAAYRNGWLVLCYDRTSFLYRSFIGFRCLHLPPLSEPQVRRGVWTDAVEFHVSDGKRCTLFLLKDGPAAEVAVADLKGVA
ncbi:MAG: DUF4126 domain-containing protein [Longimicrobiales bacterium]